MTITEYFIGNTYPGRGILLGLSPDGGSALMAYFIMGRSANSANRVFVADGDGIRTQVFKPSKNTDTSLTIYSPVRVLDDTVIITNGDQTDTVFDTLKEGGTFEQALMTRTFEPDAPIFTPRISAVMNLTENVSYKMSILKSLEKGTAESKEFYSYPSPKAGIGHIIHTYKHDGNPAPSFQGSPVAVSLPGDAEELAHELWHALDRNNRVSLFVRSVCFARGETRTLINNRNV